MGLAKNLGPDEATISVVRLTKVFTNFLTPDPVEGIKDAVTADAPSDMVAWLQANPYLRCVPRHVASPVTATIVDVETNPLPADRAAGLMSPRWVADPGARCWSRAPCGVHRDTRGPEADLGDLADRRNADLGRVGHPGNKESDESDQAPRGFAQIVRSLKIG